MASDEPIVPLGAAISASLEWLRAENLPCVLIGGVAASILGRPRATRDVDLSVWLEDDGRLDDLFRSAAEFGISPRLAGAAEFARVSRVMLLRHTPSGIELDVALASLPFEREVIEQARESYLGTASISVPLPKPEHLVVMKIVAGRPRDLADVEGILDACPGVDRKYVRAIVREFSEALEAPEMLVELDRLLSR